MLGHAAIARAVAPVGVATGEHCANRVLFKQLLQAKAIAFCQIDSCRLGGVNENLAVILMAAKFGVPVCPHAGGVGLCELVQHLSMWDYLAVSGPDGRPRHGVRRPPARALRRSGRASGGAATWLPTAPGYSSAIKRESREAYRYPGGPVWTALRQKGINNRRHVWRADAAEFPVVRLRRPEPGIRTTGCRIHRVAMACRFEVMLSSDDARDMAAARAALDEARRPRVGADGVPRRTASVSDLNRRGAPTERSPSAPTCFASARASAGAALTRRAARST